MCNFIFVTNLVQLKKGVDIIYLFLEEIGPIQQQSGLSCASLFFWLSSHWAQKVPEVSYLTSDTSGVCLFGGEGHCFKNINFAISVVCHGFGSCNSGPVSALQLPETATFMAHIQDTIKCAYFRNEENSHFQQCGVNLLCLSAGHVPCSISNNRSHAFMFTGTGLFCVQYCVFCFS